MQIGILLGVAAVVVIALWLLERMNELFCVSARGGCLLVIRGRIPPPLLHAFADIVRRNGVKRAKIRAVKGERGSRLVVSGVDEGTTQMLRNAFGLHPIQKLRSAKPIEKPNLGQVLGVAWLAWLLVGLSRRD